MKRYNVAFKRGLRYLAKKQTQRAIRELRLAVDLCGPENASFLIAALTYLGIALYRVGLIELAIKSWSNAKKLSPVCRASRFLKRWDKMGQKRRQLSVNAEDRKNFAAIQTAMYLSSRPFGCFSSPAEADAVADQIMAAWTALSACGILRGLSIDRKLDLFHQARVMVYSPAFGSLDYSTAGQRDKEDAMGKNQHNKLLIADSTRTTTGEGLRFIPFVGSD